MITTLKRLGLSEKESKVYLAALELGASAVQKIAQKAKINRATTYVILESLRKKGLATSYEQGKKTFFAAEPPQRLELLLKNLEDEVKEKKTELESIFPELKAIFNIAGNKPIVKFYEGKEGIEASRQDSDSKVKPNSVIYSFNDLDHLYKMFPKLNETDVNQRIKKNVTVKSIYTRNEGKLDNASNKKELREARFVPKNKFPFNSTISILPGKQIRITTYENNYAGVVIEDAAISNALKAVWDLAWESAEKYN
ncbi:MAG: helix-turn-helix domain-containing protein [Patescibacteria group bacterium]